MTKNAPTSETVESSDGVKLTANIWFGRTKHDASEKFYKPIIVLVHQYSLLGGCQTLMRGLAYHLSELGFICVTFDLRGVGSSSGWPSLTGGSEVNDVVSICKWTAERFNSKILLVGSSAGAPIAGSALDKLDSISAYVAVGYTFGRWSSILFGRHYKPVLECPKPKLFIMGDQDGFTSVTQLQNKLKQAKGISEMHIVGGGVGHFELEGQDYDAVLAKLVIEFWEKIKNETP